MQPIPKEQIIKRHQSLPKTLQDAIFSEKNAGIIIKVCALRDISEKATFLVGQLMSRVLLGIYAQRISCQKFKKKPE